MQLSGIDPKAASESSASLSLSAVYTALLTLASAAPERGVPGKLPPEGAEDRRLSALEQLNRHKRLVLLGDPGSGKSTFVNFVALCLAGEALEHSHANLALLTAPLPGSEEKNLNLSPGITVGCCRCGSCCAISRRAVCPPPGRGPPPGTCVISLPPNWKPSISKTLRRISKKSCARPAVCCWSMGSMKCPKPRGAGCRSARRSRTSPAATAACASWSPAAPTPIKIRTGACRASSIPCWRRSLAAQIRNFVDHWYAQIAQVRQLNQDDAQGKAALLKDAIFNSDRLLGLAERPLLLTLMASLHAWRGGTLPEKREQLYADTVDLLLDWWESPKIVRDRAGKVINATPA
jgi:hypothetical protein